MDHLYKAQEEAIQPVGVMVGNPFQTNKARKVLTLFRGEIICTKPKRRLSYSWGIDSGFKCILNTGRFVIVCPKGLISQGFWRR